MTPPASAPFDAVSVLLVDDHPVVRDGCRHLLQSSGGIVVVADAEDGESAVELYQRHQPDVVILDLGMPGIGGIETIRRLKAINNDVHILVFSMYGSETMIMRAMEAGATGYLTKSSGLGQLTEAVHSVARGKPFVGDEHLANLAYRQFGSAEDDPLRVLSKREFQLFQRFAEGQSVAEIAQALCLSPKTVGVHHLNIMRKLKLQNAAQLVKLAIKYDIVRA